MRTLLKTLLFALRFAPLPLLIGLAAIGVGATIIADYQPPPDLPFGPPVDYLKIAYAIVVIGAAAIAYAIWKGRQWMAPSVPQTWSEPAHSQNTVAPSTRTMVEPIANLHTRRLAWLRDVLSSLPILAFGALLMASIGYVFVRLGADWWMVAVAAIGIMAPPVWLFWPDWPTENDVERDRELRRQAGLPDDVEP